jgi:DNA mismatch repair protein MutS
LNDSAIFDLDLESTITGLALDSSHKKYIRDILLGLCPDPEVIGYRQDVIEDLLRVPDLAAGFHEILSRILALDRYRFFKEQEELLYEVTWRLGELEVCVDCIEGLSGLFDRIREDLQSHGLQDLRDYIAGIRREETYRNLVKELPELLAKVRSIASITIGVNLDDRLRPIEATLVSVNKEKYNNTIPSLFNRLFGRREQESPGQDGFEQESHRMRGMAQMHSVPTVGKGAGGGGIADVSRANPMMIPLFRDLSEVLNKISFPIARALKKYVSVNNRYLVNLGSEIAFYLGAVNLIQRIKSSGLSMCKPELAPKEERSCLLKDFFNLNLALRMYDREENHELKGTLITNDVQFDSNARVFILTGPNQGGKTTYTQAIGLVQVLAQAGLYVPGSWARISPVEGIYTHFPVREHPELDTGRLGEEAKRLSKIFSEATRCSLILLNESLSNTSHGESLYLLRDLVRILRLLGARAVLTTHLHELAAQVAELNSESPQQNRAVSMVSLVKDGKSSDDGSGTAITRTFKIVESPPTGRSYAGEIASKFGISFEQLHEVLKKRGLV